MQPELWHRRKKTVSVWRCARVRTLSSWRKQRGRQIKFLWIGSFELVFLKNRLKNIGHKTVLLAQSLRVGHVRQKWFSVQWMKDIVAKTLVVVCSQSVPTEFSGTYDYSWVTMLLGNAHQTNSVNDSYKSRSVQSDLRTAYSGRFCELFQMIHWKDLNQMIRSRVRRQNYI